MAIVEWDKLKDKGSLIDLAINSYHAPLQYRKPVLEGDLKEIFSEYKKDSLTKTVIGGTIQKDVFLRLNNYYIKGRIDQARTECSWIPGSRTGIIDIKYSLKTPERLIDDSLPALALYSKALNLPIIGVMNVRNYTNNKPVYIYIEEFDVDEYLQSIARALDLQFYKKGIVYV